MSDLAICNNLSFEGVDEVISSLFNLKMEFEILQK